MNTDIFMFRRTIFHAQTVKEVALSRYHHDLLRFQRAGLIGHILVVTGFDKDVYVLERVIHAAYGCEISEEVREIDGAVHIVDVPAEIAELDFIAERDVVDKTAAFPFKHIDGIERGEMGITAGPIEAVGQESFSPLAARAGVIDVRRVAHLEGELVMLRLVGIDDGSGQLEAVDGAPEVSIEQDINRSGIVFKPTYAQSLLAGAECPLVVDLPLKIKEIGIVEQG